MSQVVSFVEESCWDGDKFRSIRREIVFVVVGWRIVRGKAIQREFRADFGLWYDVDDELLIEILQRELPEIEWGKFVFFKKLDHSAIHIIDGENGKIVGSVRPRGVRRQVLSGENAGANVVPIVRGGEYRARRVAKQKAREERRRSRRGPEGC